jgi:hypothetical protein
MSGACSLGHFPEKSGGGKRTGPGVDIDDPFFGDGGSFLRVNGADVIRSSRPS